jgi:hypothetical protein
VVLKTAPIPLALREPLRPLPETEPLGVGIVLWIACDDANALHDLIVKRGRRDPQPACRRSWGLSTGPSITFVTLSGLFMAVHDQWLSAFVAE